MDTLEKADIHYSLKNIPVPHVNKYMKSLINECEKFIQRIRWHVFFFLKEKNKPPKLETYGFKTSRNAPQSPQLINFENDLTHMIANLEFRQINSQFQKKTPL